MSSKLPDRSAPLSDERVLLNSGPAEPEPRKRLLARLLGKLLR